MDTHQALIHQFFSYFGLSPDQIQLDTTPDSLTITLLVDPTETGRYIGRFASTLDSLQLLISLMINHDQPTHLNISVDVGGYREERLAVLQDMASRIESEVVASASPRAFPPLSPTDRRAIHLLYQDHATLTTYSEGEGQSRRLILAPKTP